MTEELHAPRIEEYAMTPNRRFENDLHPVPWSAGKTLATVATLVVNHLGGLLRRRLACLYEDQLCERAVPPPRP